MIAAGPDPRDRYSIPGPEFDWTAAATPGSLALPAGRTTPPSRKYRPDSRSTRAWLGASVPIVRAMPNTPALIGAAVGVLSAVMGVGGGFILVPAMIYLLGMPTKVVVGTSTFQIIFLTAFPSNESQVFQGYAIGAVELVVVASDCEDEGQYCICGLRSAALKPR